MECVHKPQVASHVLAMMGGKENFAMKKRRTHVVQTRVTMVTVLHLALTSRVSATVGGQGPSAMKRYLLIHVFQTHATTDLVEKRQVATRVVASPAGKVSVVM